MPDTPLETGFGASETLLTDEERTMLDEAGYLPLPCTLDAATVATLSRRFDELVESEGDRAGLEAHQEQGTNRLANLVDNEPLFDLTWNTARQLSAVGHVL